MRPRIKTMKALCATSVPGDTKILCATESVKRSKKSVEQRMEELKEERRRIISRAKYQIRDGKIYILSCKGIMAQGTLC